MNTDAFEARLRALEYYHTLKLLPGAWPVMRVDGRGFSRFTRDRFPTQRPVTTTRRRIRVDRDLPMKDEYSAFVRKVLKADA